MYVRSRKSVRHYARFVEEEMGVPAGLVLVKERDQKVQTDLCG